MLRITPAVRLSVGLVILIISILLVAQALGFIPGAEKQQFEIRQRTADMFASQVRIAIAHGDDSLLRDLLTSAIERNPDVKSAAVRLADGTVLVETNYHSTYWKGADPQKSTPTHIRFPLFINNVRRAYFEIVFVPFAGENHPLLHIPLFAALIVFVAVTGFIAFWLYIRRLLKYLDPNSVVPARVRNALNILAEGVLILDKREQIVLVNSSLQQKLNRSENSLLGKKASSLGWELYENQEANEFPWIVAQSTGLRQVNTRLTIASTNNLIKIFSVNAVPILGANGASQGTIAVFDDISELEEKTILLEDMIKQLAKTRAAIESKNKELTFLATRDPLTNCFNRRALYEFIEGVAPGSLNINGPYACIMADIDHFKRVNDTYGHGVGDLVIKMMAKSLQDVVREIDVVARIGGEEFCVILPGASLDIARKIAERCREKILSAVTEGVKVTASFGVTANTLGAKDSNELIHQADEALYYSKEHGRNRVTAWNPIIKPKGQ